VDFWTRMASPGPATVVVNGVTLGVGSRVRLRPRARGDVLDLVLDGRIAIVEGIEQDDTGEFLLAVTLEDDPGRDLGEARMPGHRFFYRTDEVEPVERARATGRALVAGIGNVFLGDDGFGVEVARRLAALGPIPGVDVVDFGIRGMDLVFALQQGYRGALFIDAARRGEAPGTLTVLEPELPDGDGVPVATHGMDPVRVLLLARELGPLPERVLVLCCEPAVVPTGAPGEELVTELSEPVRGAVDAAVDLARTLALDLAGDRPDGQEDGGDRQDGGDHRMDGRGKE